MRSFEITYDLCAPGRNYEELYKAIKSYGAWAKLTESTWVINANSTAAQVRDHLKQHMDSDDKLAVTGLNGDWATYGLSKQVNDWMNGDMAA